MVSAGSPVLDSLVLGVLFVLEGNKAGGNGNLEPGKTLGTSWGARKLGSKAGGNGNLEPGNTL